MNKILIFLFMIIILTGSVYAVTEAHGGTPFSTAARGTEQGMIIDMKGPYDLYDIISVTKNTTTDAVNVSIKIHGGASNTTMCEADFSGNLANFSSCELLNSTTYRVVTWGGADGTVYNRDGVDDGTYLIWGKSYVDGGEYNDYRDIVALEVNPNYIINRSFSECYQENANESHSNDGYCGLNYSGLYSYNSSLGDLINFLDGDWDTYADVNAAGGFIHINYSLPEYPRLNNVTWMIKKGVAVETYNITLPSLCYTGESHVQIRIEMDCPGGGLCTEKFTSYCYNSTSWHNITNRNITSGGSGLYLYEDAITWFFEYEETPSEVVYDYEASVIEGSETIISGVTLYNSSKYDITALMHYNDASYNTTSDLTRQDSALFSTTLTAPSVNASINVSFFLEVFLSNATYSASINLTDLNQTITPIQIDDCTTYTNTIITFDIYDEDNLFPLVYPAYNNTFMLEARMYLLNTELQRYSTNKSSVNNISICSATIFDGNYSLDFIIKYSSTDRVTESYNYQTYVLGTNNYNYNITLYDLLSTSSEECLINVKDENYLPLTDAIVRMDRRYIPQGQYITTEAPLTDSLGSTLGHFVLNDEQYNLYVTRDNSILGFYQNIIVIKPTGEDCILNLNLLGTSVVLEDFKNKSGISYDSDWDYDTNIYTLNYLSTNTINKEINLTIYEYAARDQLVLCSETDTDIVGTLSCSLTYSADQNSTAIVKAWVDGELLYTQVIALNYKHTDDIPAIRYILIAFLLPLVVLLGAASGAGAVLFYIFGLILSGGLWLMDTESYIGAGAFIIWFIVAGAILIWKINKGGVKNG